MCYMVMLSTNTAEDLTRFNDDLLVFSRDIPELAAAGALIHSNHWYVGSAHGCSCGFRHLHERSVELGFDEPVDWYPEEPQDLAATGRFIAVVRHLVSTGACVDCIDVWESDDREHKPVQPLDVDLSAVSDTRFRFFEHHHFIFGVESESQPLGV